MLVWRGSLSSRFLSQPHPPRFHRPPSRPNPSPHLSKMPLPERRCASRTVLRLVSVRKPPHATGSPRRHKPVSVPRWPRSLTCSTRSTMTVTRPLRLRSVQPNKSSTAALRPQPRSARRQPLRPLRRLAAIQRPIPTPPVPVSVLGHSRSAVRLLPHHHRPSSRLAPLWLLQVRQHPLRGDVPSNAADVSTRLCPPPLRSVCIKVPLDYGMPTDSLAYSTVCSTCHRVLSTFLWRQSLMSYLVWTNLFCGVSVHLLLRLRHWSTNTAWTKINGSSWFRKRCGASQLL
mmetsp:Transcript_12095/g.30621  ORF Transcript_12095/g.30621 Transcript_12095/m.30621 type:complete len:287 (-) Transcript_12095:108-968(-)